MKKTRFGALIAAAALTLTFAGTAFATTFNWGGNGYPQESCTGSPSSMLWIWTGGTPTSLTINGQAQSGSWEQKGQGAYQFEVAVSGSNFPPTSASVEYSGDEGVLTLSHCDGQQTTTSSSSEETTSSSSEETTSSSSDETTSSSSEETSSTSSVETETTPDGSVEELTPPQTDTIAAASSTTVSTGLLLVLAGILAAVLVVLPAAARSRR